MSHKKRLLNFPLVMFSITCVLIYFIFFYTTKVTVNNIDIQKEFSEEEGIVILDMVSKNRHQKLVNAVVLQEENYRLGLQQDVEKIQNKISNFCSDNQYTCRNFDSKKIIKQMLKDQDILLKISYFSLQNISKNNDELIYGNKMPEAINYAIKIIRNKSSLQAILAGKIPENLYIDWSMPTLLAGIAKKDSKGTNAMLGFIVSLAYIADTLKLDNDEYLAISYNISLPDYICNGKIYDLISKYTFFQKNQIMIFYNGHEIGSKHSQSKYYPKDSSLWLGEILDIESKVNSLNLMSIFSEYKNTGFAVWDNESIKIRKKLKNEIRVIEVKNINDILPGMIIAERYFNSPYDVGYNEGFSGRLAIVIAVDYERSKIFGMSYSGDIDQNKNGFGIDLYDYNTKNNIVQMFFKIDDDR